MWAHRVVSRAPRRALAAPAVLLILAIAGCGGTGGMKLHNGTDAAMATEARDTFAAVKITGVVDQNLSNLDAMLQKELAIVEADFRLKRNRALLIMADNREPQHEWLNRRVKELKSVGFENLKQLRAYQKELEKIESEFKKAEKKARRIRALGPVPPKCVSGVKLPDLWRPPRAPANSHLPLLYDHYKKACENALAMQISLRPAGKLGAAKKQLAEEHEKLADAQKETKLLTDSVNAAAIAYNEAKKQLDENPAEENVKKLQAQAEELKAALEDASKVEGAVGIEVISKTYNKALGTILVAVATGKIDEGSIKDNPRLRAAATVVSALPSLVVEAGALAASGDKPTVSNLLIELNHQRILLERAKEMKNLSDRTISLYRKKIGTLEEQASELREVQLHLCNLASLTAGKGYPGPECDEFGYHLSNSQLVCKIGADEIADCILSRQWRELLNDKSLKVRQKRELYAAILAYARALQAETESTKIDFRIIDIAHRRAVVSNRAALLAWHNLIDVPTTQLAAYHSSGITPDALSRSITNLLGLSAIGVGAAQ